MLRSALRCGLVLICMAAAALGPFAWTKFRPVGDSTWLTARATLTTERETAANASSVTSKRVGYLRFSSNRFLIIGLSSFLNYHIV